MFVKFIGMKCSIKSAPEYPSYCEHDLKESKMASLDFLYMAQVAVKAGTALQHHVVIETRVKLKGEGFLCMYCNPHLN